MKTLPAISEKEFQSQVEQYAGMCRWLFYHTRDSRKSAKGFPDLTFVRDERLIFAELKSEGNNILDASRSVAYN